VPERNNNFGLLSNRQHNGFAGIFKMRAFIFKQAGLFLAHPGQSRYASGNLPAAPIRNFRQSRHATRQIIFSFFFFSFFFALRYIFPVSFHG
jgi:hypothetical protein